MKTKLLIKEIINRKYDSKFLDIYNDESLIDYQRERYLALLNEHLKLFGERDVHLISVPGRSEITGNHTDHQHGQVLACSINYDIVAVVCKAEKMKIYSDGREIKYLNINDLSFNKKQVGTSTALVKGVLNKLVEDGYQIGNVNAVMRSNVPVGSGLSSSAAFEVMIGMMMSVLFNDSTISKIELAKDAQYAENVYFDKPCGLMDQCACAYGGMIYIDFKDPQNPLIEQVKVNLNDYGYSLCIVKTGGSHSDLTDDYASIPNEMKEIAKYFNKEYLRDIDEKDIYQNINDLRNKYGDRHIMRSLHMLQEDKRVQKQLQNLKNKDFNDFLKVIDESGNSSFKYLQNVYTSKDTKFQPLSLALQLTQLYLKDHGVCRVHGGGFAGTIQVFIQNEYVLPYKEFIESYFGKDACMVIQINNYGATEVKLS